MNFILIQIIGLIGVLFMAISFQKEKRSLILTLQIFAAASFAVHFLLLGAWTGMAMVGISAIRAYVFSLRESKKWADNESILFLSVVFFWLAGWLTWQGYLSLLVVTAMTIESFALWSKSTKKLRWGFLSARPLWIIYNLFIGSYAGLVSEAFIVGSTIMAIIRFDILKKKDGIPQIGTPGYHSKL